MSVKQFQRIDREDVERAIKALAKSENMTVSALANASGQTLTTAQVINNVLFRSGASAVTDTLPTAALIVAAIPDCKVGATFEFTINNTNSGTLTIGAGSGNTLSGTTTIATNKARRYIGKVTAVSTPAVTVYGVTLGDV
jgi:hypothetical protein